MSIGNRKKLDSIPRIDCNSALFDALALCCEDAIEGRGDLRK